MSDTKSPNVLCADAACGMLWCGSGLTECTKSGNLMRPNEEHRRVVAHQIQLPSLLYNLTAKPRTSRAVSFEPRSPATVENRTNTGVC